MPITINDCGKCGRLPRWGYEETGYGFADLILFCPCNQGAWIQGERLQDAVEGWNNENKNRKNTRGSSKKDSVT